ncbi:MAG: M3 family metallopeptidase [Candidatus Chromulinivorax sp.]|nr:M3 family metallopeptidase [Candidatus Chromulinivorax sp.]
MKKFSWIVLALVFAGCYYKKSPEMRLCSRLDWQSVVDMFPKNTQQVKAIKNRSIAIMNEMLDTLKQFSGSKTTFHNSVRVYDNAKFKFTMNMQILSTLAMLSSDVAMRAAADHALVKLQEYQADKLVRSPILLHAFQDYAHHGNDDQSKTMATRSFLKKSINHLEHEGANLSKEVIAQLTTLSRKIADLESKFSTNILHHGRSIVCSQAELAGVPQRYLDSFALHGHEYTIPLTYDACFAVLENCTQAATRKKMFFAFNQRAYPKNLEILEDLMRARDEYARLVGYKNFAEYECSLQMVGSVQRAEDFIYDIVEHANKIVKKEFAQLIADLPASVMLSFSGKLQPWDEAFVKTAYRKKHYDIHGATVAEYFPISHVLYQLQKQFGQFFALAFDQVPNQGLWHKDLICLRVRLLKTSEIIGYVVFDLYARPGKSEQASEINVIPTIQDDCHLACSGLSIVATNFTQAAQGKETLLEFHDVKILLHEFGRALHELFGATEFVDLTGTKGPRDFIEVPSQLFEMWMDDPMMVKLFSQHYESKKPLSDAIIKKIIVAEKFGRASLLQRQCLLSLISLDLGCADGSKKPHEIIEKLYKSVRCDVEYEPQDFFETSFEHLISYGSHYYGYVWSQVLAAGLFEYICKYGITSSKVGQQLYESLLSHGGSQDPHTLIELLLGSTVTKQSLLDSLQA